MLRELDSKILALLKRDGRMSWTDIARVLRVSRVTVQNRVEQLRDRGIIRGFTVVLQDESAGANGSIKAFFQIKFSRGGSVFQLAEALTGAPEIQHIWAIAGTWDALILVETDTLEKVSSLRETMIAMTLIDEIETRPVLNTLI